MPKKQFLALSLLGVILSLLICRWLIHPTDIQQRPESNASREVVVVPPPNGAELKFETSNAPPAQSLPEVESFPSYEMDAVNVDFASLAEAKLKSPHRYQLRGGGGLGRIVDSQDNVILESGLESGMHIFGCEVSPNDKLVLVQGGDGKNLILDPVTGKRLLLPRQPPNENMFAFGSWNWLDDDTVIAASGEKLSTQEAQSRANREEPGARRTRLYLYKISGQRLTEVQLPIDFAAKVFLVTQVSPDGYIHVVNADAKAALADLGWFKVRPK
jgi:hypothetical protein